MRFELIDSVTELSDTEIVAVKNVTLAEEYLGDHFPGFPVLPGVMMLETLIQAARKLLAKVEPDRGPWVLREAKNVRYGNMVRPSQQLKVQVSIFKQVDDEYTFKGVGKVGEETAVQGRFSLRELNV